MPNLDLTSPIAVSRALNTLLERSYWIPTIKPDQHYSRLQDDTDGSTAAAHDLTVFIDFQGDVWVNKHGDLRFRTFAGGGSSQRVRNALIVLAEAIRRDNDERAQHAHGVLAGVPPQEPLGEPFEKVLRENLFDLYEDSTDGVLAAVPADQRTPNQQRLDAIQAQLDGSGKRLGGVSWAPGAEHLSREARAGALADGLEAMLRGDTTQVYCLHDDLLTGEQLVEKVHQLEAEIKALRDGVRGAVPARPLTDDQLDRVLGDAYRKLVLETGYSGGMGGETWDRAAARAVEAAHGIAGVPAAVPSDEPRETPTVDAAFEMARRVRENPAAYGVLAAAGGSDGA